MDKTEEPTPVPNTNGDPKEEETTPKVVFKISLDPQGRSSWDATLAPALILYLLELVKMDILTKSPEQLSKAKTEESTPS